MSQFSLSQSNLVYFVFKANSVHFSLFL